MKNGGGRHLARFGTSGFSRLDLLIVCAVLLGLLAIALPAYFRQLHRARAISCTGRLKNIGLAFRTWASDHGGQYPMRVRADAGGVAEGLETNDAIRCFQILSNELSAPVILICPADRERRPARTFGLGMSNANLSYFLGLDASEDQPAGLLAGDRHLSANPPVVGRVLSLTANSEVRWTEAAHRENGKVALGDGSVRTLTNAAWPQFLRSAPAPMRLGMPD